MSKLKDEIRAKAEKVKEAIPHPICPCCINFIEAALTAAHRSGWDERGKADAVLCEQSDALALRRRDEL